MMKHQLAIATGLAALFVLPAATGQDGVEKLERALTDIEHALDVMTGIDARMQEDPEQAIDLVLSATEAPPLDPVRLDDRLGSLRKEVSLLQMELDALESPGSARTLQTFVPPTADQERAEAPPQPLTTGLDDALRSALGSQEPIRRTEPRHATPTAATEGPAPEYEGYSADPLGQARACYRTGRYDRALALLDQLEEPEALYWRARCLERLDRLDEAIALLERVAAAEGDSYEGQRAAKDLEFFRWKKGFLEKLPGGMQEGRKER